MTEYIETEAPDDDAEGKILEALADNHPHAFIVCRIDEESGELDLKVAVGGGIGGPGSLRALLEKTLAGLP